MRDDHLDRAHQKEDAEEFLLLDELEADEIQPLLFDLVKNDKLDVVMALLPQYDSLSSPVKTELVKSAAFSGSCAMLDLIWLRGADLPGDLLMPSILGLNIETFRYALSKASLFYFGQERIGNTHRNDLGYWEKMNPRLSSETLAQLLISDSEELWKEWKDFVDRELTRREKEDPNASLPKKIFFTQPSQVRATAGQPQREKLLLDLWKKLNIRHFQLLEDTLMNVASTTCSVKLATYLIDQGARVDCRGRLTPLHCAAKQTSAEAADMMEFLLRRGANPHARVNRSSVRIRDEKGARGISKWLGVSWDELVAQIKRETGKAIKPRAGPAKPWVKPVKRLPQYLRRPSKRARIG